MNRDSMLEMLDGRCWDVIVIGGGATGLGIAVDARTRGYQTLLLEQSDFAKATSSRSTKLVHGGVRYLKQGNISLVLEALHERGLMSQNAPHLVHDLAFVVPRYHWWEGPFYGIGLKLYDRLAGKLNFAPSRMLGRDETIQRIPNIETENLIGGVVYHDGQFDDARMAVALAQTAADHGACLVNYMAVTGFSKRDGQLTGVVAIEQETQTEYQLPGRVVINASGIFSDHVRKLDDQQSQRMVTPSQGVHLMLPRQFQPSDTAIMVPQTDDGRVLFVVPWHERVLVGTTDTEMESPDLEPRALGEEIQFILRNASRYLERDPSSEDVLSVFAGQRPLIRSQGSASKSISREHTIVISDSGLLSIIGGKWTTYRKMAEDAVDHARDIGGLARRECVTQEMRLHGWTDRDDPALPRESHLRVYGSDAAQVASTGIQAGGLLHSRLPYSEAQVRWAAQNEMARTVEDVLARRTRALVLDARASIEAAPGVARLLAQELRRPPEWETRQVAQYQELARGYLPH